MNNKVEKREDILDNKLINNYESIGNKITEKEPIEYKNLPVSNKVIEKKDDIKNSNEI